MMRRYVLAAVAIAMPSTAFAGDDGDRCAIRHFGGQWLTAISVPIEGVDTDIACRMAVDRQGKIVDSTCLKENVNAEPFKVTGTFSTGLNCRFKGELAADGLALTIDGEINRGRDVMAGLVFGADGAFEPIVLLRSASWKAGKPPKPEKPGEDDDGEKGGGGEGEKD